MVIYLGSGVGYIKFIFNENTWYILIILFIMRYVLTTLGVASNATGGVIIPTFAIGATFGMLLTVLCNKLFGLSMDYAGEIVLMSILTFYVSTLEMPFTGVALLFAFVDFKIALYLLIPTMIMMILGRLISKLNKYEDIYDVLKKYLK